MKQPERKRHAGRGGNNLTLAPLTADQALSHLLRVNPADVKKLEEQEAGAKRKRRKP
jgi:hypothetical protein